MEAARTGLTDLLPSIFLYFYFKAWYLWTSSPPNGVINFKSTSTSKPTKCMISICTPMKINWNSCLLHRLLLTITKIKNKCLINFKKSTIKLKDNQVFQIYTMSTLILEMTISSISSLWSNCKTNYSNKTIKMFQDLRIINSSRFRIS